MADSFAIFAQVTATFHPKLSTRIIIKFKFKKGFIYVVIINTTIIFIDRPIRLMDKNLLKVIFLGSEGELLDFLNVQFLFK